MMLQKLNDTLLFLLDCAVKTYQYLPQESSQSLRLFILLETFFLLIYFTEMIHSVLNWWYIIHSSSCTEALVLNFSSSVLDGPTTPRTPTTVMPILMSRGSEKSATGRTRLLGNKFFSSSLRRAWGVGLVQFRDASNPLKGNFRNRKYRNYALKRFFKCTKSIKFNTCFPETMAISVRGNFLRGGGKVITINNKKNILKVVISKIICNINFCFTNRLVIYSGHSLAFPNIQ